MINISKPNITNKEIKAVDNVLKKRVLSSGSVVEQFEKEFAKYCGCQYAILVSSGTAALHTSLKAIGISEGDEVITSPFTFIATANAILMCGAKPIFADIDYDDFNISPEQIKKKITKKTKAILPVDIFGQIYKVEEIKKIAQKYSLNIVEDACQAAGAEFKNIKAGNISDITAFSLYATKNITSGTGGIITTNNEQYAKNARLFSHFGLENLNTYDYKCFGFNYESNNISAAIAIEQLKKLNSFIKKRTNNSLILNDSLKNIKGLLIPKIKKNYLHSWHQYTIRITKDCKITRDALKLELDNNGIQSKIYYPTSLNKIKHLLTNEHLENVEKISKEVLSLPIHPLISSKDIAKIANTIKKVLK